MIILDGFKFGMLLQLAIGPICLMVFKISGESGLLNGLYFTSAVTLIDALYIFLAIFGISSIINKNVIKNLLNYIGSIILILFGVNIILNTINISIIPTIKLFNVNDINNIFMQGIVLTASNPLTIIFWGGIFSNKIIENKYSKMKLLIFGIGCILSTIIFLSFIAIIGKLFNMFLPNIIIKISNIIVGIIIICFGIKRIIKNVKYWVVNNCIG